jgi:serine/threonine protein phosphatase PrpC
MELDEIHHNIMAAHDPQSFVQDLIKTANDRGGPDNITAVAIFFTYAPE